MLQVTFLAQNGNTKLFRLTKNSRSIEVALSYVLPRKVVQVSYLLHEGNKINRWKEHGSFLELVESCLACAIDGSRQEFIDKIYASNKQIHSLQLGHHVNNQGLNHLQ